MKGKVRSARTALLVLALLGTVVFAPAATAAPGEGSASPGFVESWGCDGPATSGPLASRTGWLPSSELIRGPRGDFFGRTVGEVRDQLVWWTVPMSGGDQILVHRRALPAFEAVALSLAAAQAEGKYYAIRPQHTYGFAGRTISGSRRISNHTFGSAIDINSTTNPYRADNRLITDMPDWFVDAFRDAGFCWGGDWKNIKDPMHFAWMGPAATPGYVLPPPQAPRTSPADFDAVAVDRPVVYGPAVEGAWYVLADGNGDGAADVYHIAQRDNGVLLEYSRSSRDNSWCSVGRFFVPDVTVGARSVVLGDYQGFGRRDVFLIGAGGGGTLTIDVYLRALDVLEDSVHFDTPIPAGSSDEFLLGDQSGDGVVDLFVVRTADLRLEIWDGASGFTVKTTDTILPLAAPTSQRLFTVGDVDGDARHDLLAVDAGVESSTVRVMAHRDGYGTVAETFTVPGGGELSDVTLDDFDGDGRGDLWAYDTSGRLRVVLGNTTVASDVDGWFRSPDWECDPDARPYHFDGTFYDDDGNVHEQSIEAIAALGITRGCNPPYGDSFCPDRNVTRGEMAAFLVRALGLVDDGGRDWFVDDDDSEFQADINRLAAAGITKGCNPPTNDRFCPDQLVSRGEMAAFLVRAYELADAAPDAFGDDAGSIFEADINRLAAAGITKGCNPPANDRYCPTRPVQRDEMASFLSRANDYAPDTATEGG